MDLKLIEKFIELAKSAGVSELEYESKKSGEKLAVTFPVSGAQITQAGVQAHAPLLAAIDSAPNVAASGFKEITSPFVGTFYKSPSPDAEAYVSVGKRVSEGQVVCIIEAMKIMNEIESDISGEIVEICVENETYVEFGQVLFKVKP